jgi:hypothetical protein
MAGLQMMLSAMGIDINPDDVMKQYETLKVLIPQFITEAQQKIASLEEKQTKILELLEKLNERTLHS